MTTCQMCGAPATVHLTDIINKQKRETHLCERCAKEHKIIPDSSEPQLNLQGIMQAIIGQVFGPQTGPSEAATPDPNALTCDACGLKYAQFRATGRLGCPHDYDGFAAVLTPLLERVHRCLTHTGKQPAAVRTAQSARELDNLRQQLTEAVAVENYEEAARLRDRIRQKEAAG
jgi:protein arginine kinase activator